MGQVQVEKLPSGLSCSGDVLQEKMDNGLSGITDDTLVFSKSEAEHDQHMLNVLDTARENNIQFNPDKFQCTGDQTIFWVYADPRWSKN